MAQAVSGRGRGTTVTEPTYTRHDVDTHRVKETRRAFQTTEFFVMLAAIAGVLIMGYMNENDTLDMERIWTLVAVLASAYMISRGLAKAGSRDSIVPGELGRKLFEAAPEPREWLEVPGADHNDLPWVGGEPYLRAIRTFLDGLPGQ